MSWDNQYRKLRDYIQSGQSDKAYSLLRISPNYKGYPVDYRTAEGYRFKDYGSADTKLCPVLCLLEVCGDR